MRANSKFGSSTWFWEVGLGLILVMVLAACAPAATPTPAPSNTIIDIVWQWTSVTNRTTQETTTVPNPESYTIIFNTDGTLTGKSRLQFFQRHVFAS